MTVNLSRSKKHHHAPAEKAALAEAIRSKLIYVVGKDPDDAQLHDWYMATAYAVRDRIVDHWRETAARERAHEQKQIYYLSIEFLIGRLLFDGLCNLDLAEPVRQALADLGVDFDAVRAQEPDAALGNGGLGRLAACFMDSIATLGLAGCGYGIRYDLGLFKQQIHDGWQQELPEDWLVGGNPWEFERRDASYPIPFGGVVEYVGGDRDTARAVWYPAETVNAVAYDTPVVGWRGRHVNRLRLWSARPAEPIHLSTFNQGDYVGAMTARTRAEAISRVLYPGDSTLAGQELRLRQEFFFTSASLQDLVRRHLERYEDLSSLPEHVVVQMNDTHPSIAVAELMRILVDHHDMSWSEAWRITTETLCYTNHTLLPEALETWPVSLMNRLLPRHMQIIYLINWLHLKEVVGDSDQGVTYTASASLIDESPDKRVRMGLLAFLGSRRVNGVSALHTDLMRRTTFKEFDQLYPGRIVNKTNGISFRRWLFQANPALISLISHMVGNQVFHDTDMLDKFDVYADDAEVARAFADIRLANKRRLSSIIRAQTGFRIDPAAMFDVHIKRIHEYKRQLLNILEAIALYLAIRRDPGATWVPRVKIFAGKAAPGYVQAKLIIKLINDVGRMVNSDTVVGDRLKIVFLPNYNVSLAEAIIPAADLSEQISTAGMEASGTGNMKLAVNGAIMIGTRDGANIEICDRVGSENAFMFGLTVEEVAARCNDGVAGAAAIAASSRLAEALDLLAAGHMSAGDTQRFEPLISRLTGMDPFRVAEDFNAYWDAQRAIDRLWCEPARWWRTSILNTARTSSFSSDRTIREYARDIWRVPVPH